ncbi:Bug family tripartite tricarboxylate transporter substrate binding protein [Frigidibacter sp. ROC022]|uniref:Bug family tripartite tricarboxylate transporter substrate binding protein n=1 Tax=Frigidibacter sp. ROC022 TaxID=2971796 RepID=UPI00215AF4DD|nr:tripartite tricarboxylate transporter substrate binding protein [Frigidibacter sp. ROC022]MCR8723173.1 tripartite tricarboxylate transporter substrate binding protein [Frigidibacter sp. ROC022]
MKQTFALTLGALLATTGLATAGDWVPDQPITIIVPWSAGGSTDQVTRIIADEIHKALDATVVVENQPGASGSIGTKNALDAEKDGYTWTAGAAQDLGTYQVLGMIDTSIKDWHLYLDVANVSVIGVNADEPWQDFGELLEAMKKDPGKISVATGGITSAGHNAMEAIAALAGVEYKHVTYDGGNPAVIATVSGETDLTTQLAVEQAEMIRAGRIRPLAVLNDEPLMIEGYDQPIPPVTDWLKDFSPAPNYFGVFIPDGVPQEVIDTMDEVWKTKIANSEALKEYASQRGAVFAPYYGEDAQKRVMPAISKNAYLMFDGGKTKTDPATLGIERLDAK